MQRLQRSEPLLWALEDEESSKEEMALELDLKNETRGILKIFPAGNNSSVSRDGKASCLVGGIMHWDEQGRPDPDEAHTERERE